MHLAEWLSVHSPFALTCPLICALLYRCMQADYEYFDAAAEARSGVDPREWPPGLLGRLKTAVCQQLCSSVLPAYVSLQAPQRSWTRRSCASSTTSCRQAVLVRESAKMLIPPPASRAPRDLLFDSSSLPEWQLMEAAEYRLLNQSEWDAAHVGARHACSRPVLSPSFCRCRCSLSCRVSRLPAQPRCQQTSNASLHPLASSPPQAEDFLFTLPCDVKWGAMDNGMLRRYWAAYPEERGNVPRETADRILIFQRGAEVVSTLPCFPAFLLLRPTASCHERLLLGAESKPKWAPRCA